MFTVLNTFSVAGAKVLEGRNDDGHFFETFKGRGKYRQQILCQQNRHGLWNCYINGNMWYLGMEVNKNKINSQQEALAWVSSHQSNRG